MRALCGSIITAGALIGLGLTALGYGIRFQTTGTNPNPDTHVLWGMTSMNIMMIVLLICVGIGLAVAFLGLAFHHERRYRERVHYDSTAGSTRMPV
jgi:hypothetical protein